MGKAVKILFLLIPGIILAGAIFSAENKAVNSVSSSVSNNTVTQIPTQANTANDLLSFSIAPNTKVHGLVSYKGTIKGGYFFEGNLLINILDIKKNVLKKSNAMSKTDWMTAGPVDFEGSIDFSDLPKGPAYFEIHNDNPSDLRENDKSILIPIVID